MEKIVIRNVLTSKIPGLFNKYPAFVGNLVVNFFQKFLKVDDINKVIEIAGDKKGFDFIDSTFKQLNFTYKISDSDKNKIPQKGSLIIVSNHPLGGLDGLALLQAIGEVRNDVKVIANDILQSIETISNLFLPLDVYKLNKQKLQILNIENALNDGKAIIFFPAGKVSRLTSSGIRDLKWQNGALRFSNKLSIPILPIYVDGRNSMAFYIASLINNNIGMFMLPQELFRKRNSSINIKIGNLIPASKFQQENFKIQEQIKFLYQQVYELGNKKQ